MTTPRRAARAARAARPAGPASEEPPPRSDPSWRQGLPAEEKEWPANQGPHGMPKAFMVTYAAWRRWRDANDAWRSGPDA